MLISFLLVITFLIQGYEAFRPNVQFIAENPNYNNYFLAFLYAQGMGPKAILPGILPLAIALAVGASLAWDRKTGYIQALMIRITYKKYILGKLISAILISFFFIFISELVAFLYGVLTFPGIKTILENYKTPFYATDLFLSHPFLYVLLIIFNIALLSTVISLLTVFLSTISKNVLLVTALPWLLFIVLQFVFYALGLNRYAPIDLVGMYMLNNFRYDTLEIPLIWLGIGMVLFLLTYLTFSKTIKRGNNCD